MRETIKHFRNKFELTQEELAEKCGFHRTYVGQVERGERNPSLKIFIYLLIH
ncbi:MAG: helix-turn-helix transcriptional regulator [Ignavibacteria bacterium]|nr:helix-turn-helix transcriptional regulator [Ignavibacteria bacterium]